LGIPQHALLERVTAIDVPALVANGDTDPMILPRYSHLLAGLIPRAQLKIYPDSAHGSAGFSLFQATPAWLEGPHTFPRAFQCSTSERTRVYHWRDQSPEWRS
jgi:hypothetical protein